MYPHIILEFTHIPIFTPLGAGDTELLFRVGMYGVGMGSLVCMSASKAEELCETMHDN